MYSDLNSKLPDAWRIFFHHRNLLPIQAEAIPYILRGANTLVSSPTASGKTEAVLAPLYQRHISFRRQKVSVIHVAPTKALANDIYFRIGDYFGETGRATGIYRYTGDHHDFPEPDDGFVVVTTPEALDSLQLTKPNMLYGIRVVIVDEIHFLHGNARGEQLRYVINRIRVTAEEPAHYKDTFQIVGISATIHDLESVKKLWLGENSSHVSLQQPRAIDVGFCQIPNNKKLYKIASEVASTIISWVEKEELSKILVFANSRNEAHVLAIALRQLDNSEKFPIHLHFGILAADERDRIEAELKCGRYGICVATSTLEIGIDIGDIDATILISPPHSVISFLQRIGRGNRKSDLCKVLALYRDDLQKNIYLSVLKLAENGDLDEIHEYKRSSVGFQQVLSLAWQGTRIDDPLTRSNITKRTGGPDHDEVINDMVDMGHLKEIQGALIPSDELMDEGEKRAIHTNIGLIASQRIVDADTGEILAQVSGKVEEGLAYFGGKIKQIKNLNSRDILIEKAHNISVSTISKLPSVRYKNGLSRKIVWQIAKNENIDPRIWSKTGSQIKTWGGLNNNRLICILYLLSGGTYSLMPDDFSISGLGNNYEISPKIVYEWIMDELLNNLSVKEANVFRKPTRYYSKLSKDLKRGEALNSIPVKPFIDWIKLCLDRSWST